MGQNCVKCVKADTSSDTSSVYELPARAIDDANEKDGGKKKKTRFLRWIKGRRGQAEREEPATRTPPPVTADRCSDDDPGVLTSPDRSVSHSSDDVVQSSVLSLSDSLFNIIQTPVLSGSDTNQNAGQDPVSTDSDSDWIEDDSSTSFTRESDWETEIQQTPLRRTSAWVAEIEQTPVSQPEEKLEDEKQENESIEEINSCQYEIGKKLGKGAFGTVYEGTRLSDGWKVAVKYVDKDEDTDYISIPGYAEPIPREVALLTLASEGDDVPEIIQLLDWQDFENYYIMVLERFTPCQDLCEFLFNEEKPLDDRTARVIMWQATKAAHMCCKRGVFHRDIKLENFLINTDTLDIKLIDFGCGDFLKTSAYTEFMGTEEYFGPEYFKTGEYYAKPTTVYSLGVLLFTLVCGRFPDTIDKYQMKNKFWSTHGFSKECCSLIEACLQENPEDRIHLGKIHDHAWFQVLKICSHLFH
ncbi:putative serine/threonine-protein kinase pim-2-like [Triplophysa rosa]|uniref:non-specific serine/threonine protein kinase n=1 Tax=Triplophysa rosa TaxID=992332 RepID=A0A9W7WDK8_TRIRA|nr:putative serine/threonine-protein kinase pim-2-like [Triplophysa rosa]